MIRAADGMNQFLNTRNGDLHWGQEAWEPVNCVPVGELEQANRRFQSSRSDWEWQNNAILAHAGTGAIAGALPVDEAQYKMQQLLPSGSSNPAAAQTLFAAQPQQFSSFNSPFHPYPLLDPSHSHHSLSPGLSYPALSALSAISDPRRRFFDFEPVKRESFFPDLAPPRLGLNLGVRTYFSSDDSFGRFGKRLRANSPSIQIPLCQAEGCKADLSTAKHYHRRHKVCELHSKASNVIANGQNQRFCQQCSRFHPLAEFDEGKRSCRKRLADHNRRRRKPQPVSAAAAAESKEDDQDHPSSAQGTDADADDPKTASEEPVASNSKKSSSPTASGDSKTGSVGNSLQLNTSSSGVSSKSEHKGKIVNRNQSISASEGSNLATATSTIHASASSTKRQAQFPNEQESVYHQMLQDVCMQTSGPKLSLSSSTNNGSGCSISHSQSFNTNSSNIDIQMHSHPVSWLKPLSSRPDPNSSPNFHSIISNGPISNRSGLQSVDFMSDNLDNQQMFTLLENSSIRDNLNAPNAASQHSRTPVEFLHQISSLNGPSNSNSGNADQHPGSKFDELQAWRPFGSRFDHSGSNIM